MSFFNRTIEPFSKTTPAITVLLIRSPFNFFFIFIPSNASACLQFDFNYEDSDKRPYALSACLCVCVNNRLAFAAQTLNSLAVHRVRQLFYFLYLLRGWRILEQRRISEFDIDAVLLEHLKTNARLLHLGCSDTNNVFNVSFRTTPMDSTGVAHILEHTTLCGSQKFPVRDPFFKMLNRSLSTFMNAMTGPDYTLYPFSTCNEQDYKNLMRVYLDSVFFPLLREIDFIQEGWRLEPEDMKDLDSPLVIKVGSFFV